MITTDAPKYTPQMGLDSLRVAGSAAAKRQNPSPWRMNSPSEQSLERKSPSSRSPVQLAATSTKFPSTVVRGMMKQPQVCDHCGGRFGMVTHRWWGNKFCKRTCKGAYLRELTLDRDKLCRWYGFPSRGVVSNFSPPDAQLFPCKTPSRAGWPSSTLTLRTETAARANVPSENLIGWHQTRGDVGTVNRNAVP
jgi:hypothetical protein